MLSESELMGCDLVWLLDITFKGRVWRFSQFTIDISKNDGDVYQYIGGINNINYEEKTDLIGVNVDGNSISLSLIFPGVNFVEEWRRGFVLDGSQCELSYVLIRDGIVQQTYENRERLFLGEATESIFGDPLEPVGFVAFSIENKPYSFDGPMTPQTHVISDQTFPGAWEESIGKLYPLVIGAPGAEYTNSSGGSTLYNYSTPGYLVKYQSGEGAFNNVMIAGHAVKATHVRIRDARYNAASLAVVEGVDANGALYSYVDIQGAGLILANSLTNDKREYWITWNYDLAPFGGSGKSGGALVNSEGDDFITGAGDICIWALRKTGAVIDYPAWESLRGLLNGYKFSGYVNEPVTAWSWLQNNILAFLPIEARAGVDGIRPLISLLFINSGYTPARAVTMNSDFQLISAIETISDIDEIINRYELKWAKSGYTNTLIETHIVEADRQNTSAAISSSEYAWASINRYGLHEKTENAFYVYDRNTAARIAQEKVRAYALPSRTFTISANVKYGFLNIGDVIRLTSDVLFFENIPVNVVGKSWTGTNWRFIIQIEENTILNSRTV